jgi:hypothetical protein
VDPWTDCGEAELFSLIACPELGVVTGVWWIEAFRDAFFDALADDVPTGIVAPLPRLRFLMMSVFRESGRTTPCNFRKRPQALQRGWPSGFRRHRGVVWVKQFVHVVGTPFCSLFFMLGLSGREGAVLLNPDSGGEFGLEACM